MSDILLFVILALFVGILIVARRFSFAGQRPEDYDGTGPAIDIRQHLAGPIVCEGVIYGPTGRVSSRFVADMHGSFDGDTGRLAEHFRYAGGNEQQREWRLTLTEGGSIRAEADDIVGTGTGWQRGSAVNLRYRIRLPENAGGWALDVTDWMYLLDNGTIFNRSQFRKFGIQVAELVATLRPAEPGAESERTQSGAHALPARAAAPHPAARDEPDAQSSRTEAA